MLVTLFLAWLMLKIIKESVVEISYVANESMLPYLTPRQFVVIGKFAPCLHVPFTSVRLFCSPCRAGHAYVFRNPQNISQRLVKFATSAAETSCYFEGSNRENSVDSRHFGRVPVEKVEGKILYPNIHFHPKEFAP